MAGGVILGYEFQENQGMASSAPASDHPCGLWLTHRQAMRASASPFFPGDEGGRDGEFGTDPFRPGPPYVEPFFSPLGRVYIYIYIYS